MHASNPSAREVMQENEKFRSLLHSEFEAKLEYLTPCLKNKQKRMAIDGELQIETGKPDAWDVSEL